MSEYLWLWLPCMTTVVVIVLCAFLFKEFLKKRAGHIALEGGADNDSASENVTTERAACTCTSSQVNERTTSPGYDYEVFLSFRGSDTRVGFTDFLYTSLIDVGIRAYKDDRGLPEGEELGPKLRQAINESKILIPIFSKGYASSEWCLKELVHMVECRKTRGQNIMPIFYDVAPAEVRHQTGDYGEAFLSHEKKKRHDKETMREWKAALSVVGSLKGWDLQSMPNRREGEFAKTLTQKLFIELKKAYLVVSDNLVSVDHHVDKIMEMIGAESSETRIIGIHGLGGIGKTTIAKVMYNKLLNNFDGCCFLSNIREMSKLKGIEYLQNQLISDILKEKWIDISNIDEGTQTIKDRLSTKKVLLLLDDVEEKDHMNAFVGNRDWFGKGSKIIITTRNKKVLKVPEVDNCYEVSGMNPNQSLQLFCKHAFRRDYPLDEYIKQSKMVVKIAGGLPLALEVIGSLLSSKTKKMWDVTLKKLENVPDEEIQSKLKISYNALDIRQKHIFLDIACLFIGYDNDIMIQFWDESMFAEEAMEVLENMSLIKINENNEVWMHDQLRDLGRELVRGESEMKIEKQSRVWDPEEALVLLRRHEEKEKVEALCLNLDHQHCFAYKDFKRLPNLRYLRVNGSKKNFRAEATLLWAEPSIVRRPAKAFKENSDLLPQLRWLFWHDIPTLFDITNFSIENMVIVDLSGSEITHYWDGWRHMEVMKNLKVLNLTNCHCLERTPIFSPQANLKRLILRGCKSLVKIDRSIGQLKGLVFLDVRKCSKLQSLPEELGGDLASLEYLFLRHCQSLERLPDSIGNLDSLIELDISYTRIKNLPDSIGNLKNLKAMKMWNFHIIKIPDTLWTIEKLEKFEGIRFTLPRVHVKIGDCIYGNQSLGILRLHGASIYALPRLPESLIILQLSELVMNSFPDLSNLTNLKELDVRFGPPDCNVKSDGCMEVSIPWWIGSLSKLESLDLDSHYVTSLPTDLSLPPQLKSLRLRCSNLRCLPRLPSSLSSLCLEYCYSLCSMDLSNLHQLSTLEIWFAAIAEIQHLSCLENLRILRLLGLGKVETLPDLSTLNKLRHLFVRRCDKLVDIQGRLPESLEELDICFCESLEKLPNLSNLNRLQMSIIVHCRKLNVEAILALLGEVSQICGRKQ